MTGKILAFLIFINSFIFMIIFVLALNTHLGINERINDITYDFAETVSTAGEVTEELYAYFTNCVSRYGDFSVEMKLESNNNGSKDTFYKKSDILNRKLDQGDRLTIALYQKDANLVEKLSGKCVRAYAVKTAIIA